MAPKDDFNPHSYDATFATILQRLDEQDKNLKLLPEVLEQVKKTNGRVTALEARNKYLMYIGSILLAVLGLFCTIFQH